MALVTIQRSPSINSHDSLDGNGDKSQGLDSKGRPFRQRSLSESYFAVKGAALVLPQNECTHSSRRISTHGGDIQLHLQSMFYLLRPDDTLKMAVKLESMYPGRTRYLVVLSCTERQDTEESIILGIDCKEQATIGLVLPVWADTKITLDGDGGFSVSSNGRHHIFKPVSVQAMWSALQSLHKAVELARYYNYFPGGLTHFWAEFYENRISSDRSCLNEWHAMEDIESRRPFSPDSLRERPCERESAEITIRGKLREIMMQVDLDEVTSKAIRTRVEEELNMDLSEYKSFIDQEMIVILGQMDSATEIFNYLYLGSEWNASNLEELRINGVGYILNVTREIDNFYPGLFTYLNIRVYDEEGVELLKHWDATYRFIAKAKEEGSKVLVHCRMGISRSASVVIAYAMKAYSWSLEIALRHVKEKRTCINPNPSFMKQLEVYQGILDASKQRHNLLWRSKSENDLKNRHSDSSDMGDSIDISPDYSLHDYSYLDIPPTVRPKSWSPDEATIKRFFPDEFSEDNAISRDQMSFKEFSDKLAASSELTFLAPEDKESSSFLFGLPESNERPNQLSLQNTETVSFQIGEPELPSPSPPYFVISEVTEGELSDWTEPVSADLQSLSLESKALSKLESPRVRKVSSVKDRINELELNTQPDSASSKTSITENMHPESRGLVLNLANQFETKTNTPSPVEEFPVFATPIKPNAVEVSPSQIKPSVSKVITIPTTSKTESLSSILQEEFNIGKPPIPPTSSSAPGGYEFGIIEGSGEVIEQYAKEAIPWNAGTVKRQKQDYEEKVKQTSGESPELIRRNSLSSLGSRSPLTSSNEEILDSGDSKQKHLTRTKKNDSSSSHIGKTPDASIKTQVLPKTRQDPNWSIKHSSSEQKICEKFLFERPSSMYGMEEIPFTPGTVRRAKQQLEERHIKRTNSFDGGLVYRDGNLISVDANKALRPIQRSHSWRTESHPMIARYHFDGKLSPIASQSPTGTLERQASKLLEKYRRDQNFLTSGSRAKLPTSPSKRKSSGFAEKLTKQFLSSQGSSSPKLIQDSLSSSKVFASKDEAKPHPVCVPSVKQESCPSTNVPRSNFLVPSKKLSVDLKLGSKAKNDCNISKPDPSIVNATKLLRSSSLKKPPSPSFSSLPRRESFPILTKTETVKETHPVCIKTLALQDSLVKKITKGIESGSIITSKHNVKMAGMEKEDAKDLSIGDCNVNDKIALDFCVKNNALLNLTSTMAESLKTPPILNVHDEKTVRSLVGKFEDGEKGKLRRGSETDTPTRKKDYKINWARRNSLDDRKIYFDLSKKREMSTSPVYRTAPPLPPGSHKNIRNGARTVLKLLKKFSMPDYHVEAFSKNESLGDSYVNEQNLSQGPLVACVKKTEDSIPETFPLSTQLNISHEIQKKVRKLHGKMHPLSQLEAKQRNANPLYNTM